MKIIQHGDKNPDKNRVFFCPRCNCIFEAEREEYLVQLYAGQKLYGCHCPECNALVSESYPAEQY